MKFLKAVNYARIGSLIMIIQSIAKIIINIKNPERITDYVYLGSSIFELIGFGFLFAFFFHWHRKLNE